MAGVAVSKTNLYAVLAPALPLGVAVSKANLYAVLAPALPLPGVAISKANLYALVNPPALAVSKMNLYAVLGNFLPLNVRIRLALRGVKRYGSTVVPDSGIQFVPALPKPTPVQPAPVSSPVQPAPAAPIQPVPVAAPVQVVPAAPVQPAPVAVPVQPAPAAPIQPAPVAVPVQPAPVSGSTIAPDAAIHPVPALPKPAAGASYTDPVYGSTIKRLTDSANAPNNAGSGFLNTIRPEYSTVCPWSLGNNWLILQHGSYFGLYSGAGVYLLDLPFFIAASSEPRWSRTDPNLLFFHAVGGNALLSYNVATGATATVHVFAEYGSISGGGEMDTAVSGDFLVYAGDGAEAFIYDVAAGRKSPVVPIGAAFDSLYVAPDASRFTITESGVINEYLAATGAALSPVPLCQSGSHMDVAALGGAQYLVRTNSNDSAPLAGWPNAIELVSLAGGAQTGLLSLPWSEAVHVSTSDVGLAVVETYAALGTAWDAFMNEILLVALDGSIIRRVAQHRSAVADYNSMPLTSVRRDGRYAVFASNWGDPSAAMDTYLIAL